MRSCKLIARLDNLNTALNLSKQSANTERQTKVRRAPSCKCRTRVNFWSQKQRDRIENKEQEATQEGEDQGIKQASLRFQKKQINNNKQKKNKRLTAREPEGGQKSFCKSTRTRARLSVAGV